MNAQHQMSVQKRVVGECEHGCHEHTEYHFVCSCGVDREIEKIGDYWHKELKFLGMIFAMQHRIEILEKLAGVATEGALQVKELL